MTGRQFKTILKEKGLEQKNVASEIGVSPQTLSNYLNGRQRELKKSKYYRLCSMLDVLF